MSTCAKAPIYQHHVQTANNLVDLFRDHPCCAQNCVGLICNLPPAENGYCSTCHPLKGLCKPTTTQRLSLDQRLEIDDKNAAFIKIVTATRANWDKFHPEKVAELSTELKAELSVVFESELLEHFKAHGQKRVNGQHWNWDDCYYIIKPDLSKVKVCVKAWSAIAGITKGQIEYAQKRIREGETVITKLYDDPNECIDQAKAFAHWGMNLDTYQSYVQSFCDVSKIPQSEASIVASAYLADFFDLVGEAQPGVLYIHYDPMTYMEIWETYKDDEFVKSITSDILSYPSFCKLLREVFPKVVPREYKSVSGKCDVCESLRSKMKECKLRSDRMTIKRYKLFHRNMYMGEKLKYYQRINEAKSSDGRTWSFIFDAMSKDRTRLPILANMAQMSTRFENDVMGCIFHNGQRTQLYVSGPSVKMGVSYMIHCVHSEIKRCIDAKLPLPNKIYLQIDGASDNTGYAVLAALEHLVGAGLCPVIEVWRLPVGHTHEDIDGRFGVLSMHLREQSIEHPEKFFAEAKDAFLGDCEVTYTAAIYDYKKFYDSCIDKLVMVKKKEFTQLGFRIERLSADEIAASRGCLHLVKVNYRKCASDIIVDLREMNPLYNTEADSTAEIFYPVVILPRWMPKESIYEEDRLIGMCFMDKTPVGTPEPMALAPWAAMYRDFIREMKKRYPRSTEEHIFNNWSIFLTKEMPTIPGSSPPIPSDEIMHFIEKYGSDFQPPLGKYLYGPAPMGFDSVRYGSCSSTNDEEIVSMTDEFKTLDTNHWSGKTNWIDDMINGIVVQEFQTIPHKLNKDPFRKWEFEFAEMMQGVIVPVKTYNSDTKKFDYPLKPGRIVAYSKDDINHAPIYRVSIFNDEDPLAKKNFVDIDVQREYYQARFRYREAHPDEETGLDDKYDSTKTNAEARAKSLAEKESRIKERQDAKDRREHDKLEKIRLRELEKEQKAAARAANNARKITRAVITPVVVVAGVLAPIVPPVVSALAQSLVVSVIDASGFPSTDSTSGGIECDVEDDLDVDEEMEGGNDEEPVRNLINSSRLVDTFRSSSRGRIVKDNILSGFALCQCGCEASYDVLRMRSCLGMTSLTRATGCTKRYLSTDCCPSGLCRPCEVILN